MLSYKEFKKGYLNEWVDRSQAARKAAEELAKKEVKPSLRDKYKPQTTIMTLNGKQVEFKVENEKKPDGDIYFTYEEAIKNFGKPDKDGWRLPTKEEHKALEDNYLYVFDAINGQGVIDRHLYLPAVGYRGCNGNVYGEGYRGYYWSSMPDNSENAWFLYFEPGKLYTYYDSRCCGQSVRLVRDVK